MRYQRIVVFNNIKLPINASFEEAFSVAYKRMALISRSFSRSDLFVFKRSIDARRKDNILFVYSVAAPIGDLEISEKLLQKVDAVILEHTMPAIKIGKNPLEAPPVIVGTGPCGLFAALLLAEHGYSPIVIERGSSVKERADAVRRFNQQRVLDPESNIQFGAGGAGTFSDGKLVTRINDPLTNYVMDRLVEYGAPEEIKYIAKPHIGTDILSTIVDKILAKISELGGKVLYNTKFLSVNESFGKVKSVNTSAGEIDAGALILAIGHSARDTYLSLIRNQFDVEAKSFSVGMRIEHPAEDIDKSMFGDFAGHPSLGHAEYNLSYNTKVRGVYTFCMCPGGEVVAAASEECGVVVNGMSYHARSGANSNCAVVCSVFKEDYGSTPELAIEMQRKIERQAFVAGGSNYSAPIITVGDFLSDKLVNEPDRVKPTYMNGAAVRLTRPEEYLPGFVTQSIKSALTDFDKKIKGFAAPYAVLTGAETRTSAPVRIKRDPITRLASGYSNLYPSGEGAGYAGGITSAAIDGIKSAMALINEYKPKISR